MRATALSPLTAKGLDDGDLVALGNERGRVQLHVKPGKRHHEDTIIVESVWPNDAWSGGICLNQLLSAEPAPPDGGAAIHDTAVWLARVEAIAAE